MRRDTQTLEEKIEALESLLPLLEAHISCRMTRQYGTGEGAPPERPQGWVPPPPEPDCDPRGWRCEGCPDFEAGCTLREIPHFQEYERLRDAYPQLRQFEGKDGLLADLMAGHADWALALYWVYVEPWDRFEPDRRREWAKQGVRWLAEHFRGYVPTYEPEKWMRHKLPHAQERQWVKDLRMEGLSYDQIHKVTGYSKTTIRAYLSGQEVRSGRIVSAGRVVSEEEA